MNEDFPAVSKTLAAAARARSGSAAALPVLRSVRLGLAAFATGARTIPLGDNGTLLRDLASRGGPPARSGAAGIVKDR